MAVFDEYFPDLSTIDDIGAEVEQRAARYAERASQPIRRKAFERCHALRFTCEQLENWWYGEPGERERIESNIAVAIDSARLGGRERKVFKWRLAQRAIVATKRRIDEECTQYNDFRAIQKALRPIPA